MALTQRIFDFITDPFGIKRCKDKKELDGFISQLDYLNKEIDKAFQKGDYLKVDILIKRMEHLKL